MTKEVVFTGLGMPAAGRVNEPMGEGAKYLR